MHANNLGICWQFNRQRSYGTHIQWNTAAAAKSLQSCLTLCDPRDSSPPGSTVPGTLQARTLEWVAISFFNAWKWKVKVKSLSRVLLLATPWTAAHQAPLSMGFSRQEYWSGVPSPSPQERFSCVQFSQYFLVRWSIYIVFFSEWCFQIFFFGSFAFQRLEYIIPLSPCPLGFCWEIFLDPNEGSLVNSRSGSNS